MQPSFGLPGARPATANTLTLDRAPDRSLTADAGTPRAAASARLASAVARPPSGAARTRTTTPAGPAIDLGPARPRGPRAR